MKKIFFALYMSVCTLTCSLSVSAQTIIESRLALGLDNMQIIQSSTGDLYYYWGSRDSTHIAKIVGNNLSYLLRVAGNNFESSYLLISPDNKSIYFSLEGKICSIKTDGGDNGSYRIIFEENDSRIIPLAIDGNNQWIAFMRQSELNRKLITIGLYSLGSNSYSNHIISSSTGVVIGHNGFVGSMFWFSGVGRHNSTIYQYDCLNSELHIISQDGISEHGGMLKQDNFYYAEQNYQEDSITIHGIKLGYDNFSYKIPKLYPSVFYTSFEGPDGELIVQGENNTISFDFNTSDPKIWDKPYSVESTKWNSNYLWTRQSPDFPFEDTHTNLYMSTDGLWKVVATVPGFVYHRIFVKDDKGYVVGRNQAQDQLRLISFDLVCPESLTITQSMVDTGQTLFKAQHINIKGLISVNRPITIYAGNDIQMTPTSAFYVVEGGSVEVLPSTCPTN
jgi:hypothetical protein